jgi:hypothetical protein
MCGGVRRWGIGAAVAVVVSLLFAPVPAAAAAVAAPADLGTVLAVPADPSYKAVPNGVQGFGPVDAMSFASSSNNVGGVLLALVNERFTRAYRKGWTQQSTGTLIIETVVEFESSSGAKDLYGQLKQADQGSRGLFDTPGFDQAYGVAIIESDGFRTSSIAFVKGNLVYIVITGNKIDPSTALVLEQAAKAYDFAPPQTVDPNGFLDSATTRIVIPLGLLALVVLVGIPVLLVFAARWLFMARARSRRDRMPDRPALWDGSRWRSPDGFYWFDGVDWRPVPPAG